MAKFYIFLTIMILSALLDVNQATTRLPELLGIPPKGYDDGLIIKLPDWLAIPPKDYNVQVAKRLPEWSAIPPKDYNNQLTTLEIAPSLSDDLTEGSYEDMTWLEATSSESIIPAQ